MLSSQHRARGKRKKSERASLQDEMVCLGCPLTKKRLEWVRNGLIDLPTMSNRYTDVLQFGALVFMILLSQHFAS